MKDSSLARRYAGGLVQSIEGEKEYREIETQLRAFLNLINDNEDIRIGMTTPLYSKRQKMEVLETFYKKAGVHDKTFRFLQTVIDSNRLEYLEVMIELLEELWFEKNDIQRLKVFSAVALPPDLEKKLIGKLEKSFGKKIVLEKYIEESLIAGLKIQKGSIFYDFSIEGNLENLKEALIEER